MSSAKLVIGLTGGIGSGKTTVANLFADLGVDIIDSDVLARVVTDPSHSALAAIVARFGATVLQTDGTLNRRALRQIIFADDTERQWLEQLLHPLIRLEMAKQIALSQSAYCIAVIPLLLETLPNPLIQRILVVDSPEEDQIKRTQARDQTPREHIKKIISIQISRSKRLIEADDIIYNDKNLDHLIAQVTVLHAKYLSLQASF